MKQSTKDAMEITIPFLFLLAFVLGAVVIIGFFSHDCPIPTRQELQEKLDVRPDGIIGQETLTAWKEYELKLFNEYALEAMERMETAK